MSAQETFDAWADLLITSRAGIARGPALESPGLRIGDELFAFVLDDELVLRLPPRQIDELLAQGGSPLTLDGRTWGEWVSVQPADDDAFILLMEEARAFVESAASDLGRRKVTA